MAGSRLPSGTVTFLFTDIEGSTRLIEKLGEEGYVEALAEHRRLLRDAFSAHRGAEVDTQGDAFLYAFADPVDALAAAAEGQQALAAGPVKVRMGLHTGEPRLTGEGYAGRELHRAARIAASGHGGQVVVSATTRALVDGDLTELGEHRLKDIWYAGRADDVIISAGYRIGPFEVESVCIEHPAVREAAAVASPDERRGAVVKAFIVLAAGNEPSEELAAEISGFVRTRLSQYAYPRKVEFVDDLPKTLTGKIRRIELREREQQLAHVPPR